MSTVVTETRGGLVERRQAILGSLGLTQEDLATLAQTQTLTAVESEALEELEEIAFLLGE